MPILPEIKHEIAIPEGVTVTIDAEGNGTHIKGAKGELSRAFRYRGVAVSVEDGNIVIYKHLPRREHKAICGTYASHIRNMIQGVVKGWEYEMKVVYNHFPIKTSIKGDMYVIDNFLGERHPRTATILPGVKIVTKGEELTITGIDREAVSQTAANIEQATKIRGRDIRVFQDGIYITSKDVKS
jgi:large subunit ribosomal protein L6